MFCPQCKGLMRPSPKGLVCLKCNTKATGQKLTQAVEEKELVVFGESDAYGLPTTDEFACPQCGKREAYFRFQQTRSSDEPATIFLQCVKCKNRWRKY